MTINIPKVVSYESKYQNSKTKLTILLLKNDSVYGYYGNDINAGRSISIKEVRSLLQEALAKFTNDSLIVIIKPGIEATYQNTVDMLDEMTINKIKRFEMNDINKEESKFLDEKKIK